MNQKMLFNDILPITLDYAFCKVMEDNPEICRKLVQLILMDDLGEIELVVQKQKAIDTTPDGRGVRLDVYVKALDFVCNIEMQTTDKKNHGRRARYYQSMIDADLLDKGQAFTELTRSYVIFLCPFDPFGKEERIYRFTAMSKEHPDIDLETDAEIWFVCATEVTCRKDDALGHFLRYMRSMIPTDVFTEEVQRAVEIVSRDAKWRKEMYTWYMKIQEEREAAVKRTQKELVHSMKENGLPDDKIAAIVKLPIEVVVQLENEPLEPQES